MTQYGTILADPPWPYHSPAAIVGNGGRGWEDGKAATRAQVNVTRYYPTLSMDRLKAMPVRDLAADACHLYLWTTNSFLVEAHELARAWGFKPKTVLTWVKVGSKDPAKVVGSVGHYYRSASEHIVFAVRGRMRLKGPVRPTAYLHPRLPHSVKPEFFAALIEEQSPGPYLELFARRVRPGWDCWGDEVESTVPLAA